MDDKVEKRCVWIVQAKDPSSIVHEPVCVSKTPVGGSPGTPLCTPFTIKTQKLTNAGSLAEKASTRTIVDPSGDIIVLNDRSRCGYKLFRLHAYLLKLCLNQVDGLEATFGERVTCSTWKDSIISRSTQLITTTSSQMSTCNRSRSTSFLSLSHCCVSASISGLWCSAKLPRIPIMSIPTMLLDNWPLCALAVLTRG
ncbi:hypothetical protein PsorP6_004914 [Peronosclerospora sorghi]|uniref:Uncharacterized protein n=1 Tax=Peronosclerospora sorghi TaxID=230839 RepID=A0ACC0W4S6_9STRA|nr:hypothetical protein PsorP6_004914 [Peronosclerospora sorghi]